MKTLASGSTTLLANARGYAMLPIRRTDAGWLGWPMVTTCALLVAVTLSQEPAASIRVAVSLSMPLGLRQQSRVDGRGCTLDQDRV